MSHLDWSPALPPDSHAWPPRFVVGGGGRALTVLLVDDDSSVLSVLGETISALGHSVIVAKDGRDALRLLFKCPFIDCLCSDIVMPNGMTGLQLLAAARALCPGLPVVLTSAYSREDVSALGDIPYDVAFIAKPYLLTDMRKLLDNAARSRRPVGGAARAHPRSTHGKPH
jgi:DNA-binding NtrC family response regulator